MMVLVASLTEMRQKTYWTSQTVTAHKDGWPSLLVTTSLQGGPITLAATLHGRKGSQVLAGKSGPRGGGRQGEAGGVVWSPGISTNYRHCSTD